MKTSIIKSKDNKEKIPIFTMHVTKGHLPYFPQMTKKKTNETEGHGKYKWLFNIKIC